MDWRSHRRKCLSPSPEPAVCQHRRAASRSSSSSAPLALRPESVARAVHGSGETGTSETRTNPPEPYRRHPLLHPHSVFRGALHLVIDGRVVIVGFVGFVAQPFRDLL